MELSNMKHIQQCMTSFEIEFGKFERQPLSDQLSNIFTPITEEIFGTIETADIDMNPSHSMVESVVNRNFGNKFQNQNGPNQRQHTHKKHQSAVPTQKHYTTVSAQKHWSTESAHKYYLTVSTQILPNI